MKFISALLASQRCSFMPYVLGKLSSLVFYFAENHDNVFSLHTLFVDEMAVTVTRSSLFRTDVYNP